MRCKLCNKRRTGVFWDLLVGATFVLCGLLLYQFLVFQGIIFSSQSQGFISSQAIQGNLMQEECSSFCNKQECIDISNVILSNMNQSADPCEDFYNFACGNFEEKFRNEGDSSLQDQLSLELLKSIRDVIEQAPLPDSAESTPESAIFKLKVVYESCMDKGSSDLASLESIVQFLQRMGLTNWPNLNSNFSFGRHRLPEVLGRLSAYGEDVFFHFTKFSNGNPEESGHLYEFQVHRKYLQFKDEEEIRKVTRVLYGILSYTGMRAEEINQTLSEFKVVNNPIYNVLENDEEKTDCEGENSSNHMILDCLQDNHSHILCRIVQALIRNGRISSRYISDRVYIPCDSKDKVNKIIYIMRNYDDRYIANYIAMRIIINNLNCMGFTARKNFKQLLQETDNEAEAEYQTELDRWKHCVGWIAFNMKFPLGMMYVTRKWPPEAADELNGIFGEFVQEIKAYVSRQQWIGEETKVDLLKEMDAGQNCLHNIIQDMRNQTQINSLYEEFLPVRSSFMSNVFKHKKLIFTASKLNKEGPDNFKQNNPFTVEAFGADDIYLSFGMTLAPFYRHGYPHVFNIAKIGQIIGHELGHKLYYFFERLGGTDNQTLENFNRKQDCLIDQYSKYKLKRIQKFIKSNQTVSEDFADRVGITFSEKVSEPYLRDMENKEFTLPGHSYSPEKMLYISYAQVWCAVRSIETEQDLHDRDEHSPPEFRVKGLLQNSQRFSQVFNCPTTSYMNPSDKCSVLE